MFRLKNHLISSCVYVGKKIIFAGCIRAQVKEIHVLSVPPSVPSSDPNNNDYQRQSTCLKTGGNYANGGDTKSSSRGRLHDSFSAFITPETKFVFRSESAKYFIFLQISEESFKIDPVVDEASGGQEQLLIFEKAVYGFLPELFDRWRLLGANHVVSIVLFARVLYDPNSDPFARLLIESGADKAIRPCDPDIRTHLFATAPDNEKENHDHNGRLSAGNVFYCKDFFKVVVDWETRADWNSVLSSIKREAAAFYRSILERTITVPETWSGGGVEQITGTSSPITRIVGSLTQAADGNILEAVNLALNIFDKHYIDRDLLRTGLSVVVITASNGLFRVPKHLLRLTTERMIEDGN
jgi:hypothetical protein